MPHPSATAPDGTGQNCAVINPYALAELLAGRRIPWSKMPDVPRVLEQILGTPYEELFDPKYGGPLYIGHRLNARLELEREHSPLLDVERESGESDLVAGTDFASVRSLGDLAAVLRVRDLAAIAIDCLDVDSRHVRFHLELPHELRVRQLARVFTNAVVRSIAYDPEVKGSANQDWTPSGATWGDAGRFFNETAEFFDPVQGAVANCYYIAALSAVAWAMPYRLAQITRATGQAQDQFFDMVRFYTPDSGGTVDREIEVSETVPLSSGGNFIYCRSSEAGEVWPAIYEKAFAKLKTGTTTDHPDITATGWGDCVLATAQLTGGHRAYFDTASRSGDQLWDLVRSHSLSYRTFHPMTAWTYSSGDASPDKVDYSSAHIVGSHCYTVLGWAYRNCRKYIVLRNPWGNTEATASALDATLSFYDVSWWRPVVLKNADGTFAMEAGAFKKYFAGIGVAV